MSVGTTTAPAAVVANPSAPPVAAPAPAQAPHTNPNTWKEWAWAITVITLSVLGSILSFGKLQGSGALAGSLLSTFTGIAAWMFWKAPSAKESFGIAFMLFPVLLFLGALWGTTVFDQEMRLVLKYLKLNPDVVRPLAAPTGEHFTYDAASRSITVLSTPDNVVWVLRANGAQEFLEVKEADGNLVAHVAADSVVFFQNANDGRTSSPVPVTRGARRAPKPAAAPATTEPPTSSDPAQGAPAQPQNEPPAL